MFLTGWGHLSEPRGNMADGGPRQPLGCRLTLALFTPVTPLPFSRGREQSMATGGGGGSSRRRRSYDGDVEEGGGDGRFVRGRVSGEGSHGLSAAGDGRLLDLDWEHSPPHQLPARSPQRAEWEKAWTSAGQSSSVDPLSHYLAEEG